MVTIFPQRLLTANYVNSQGVVIAGKTLDLYFTIEVLTAATVQLYLEYSEDGTDWFREVSEEASAGGVVANAVVVRSIQANGGSTLAPGTHRINMQFERVAPLMRLAARVSAGSARLIVQAAAGASIVQ